MTEETHKWIIQRHRTYLAQSIKREQNKNATHKTKKMSNSDLAKESDQGAGVVKSKQFLFLKRHPLCYSWSSPVKSLIEERKNPRNREKGNCHLRNEYFVSAYNVVMTTMELL
jgi:hypothetical protein